MLTLRFRTPVGTFRLNEVSPSHTFQQLRQRLLNEHHANIKGNFFLDIKDTKTSTGIPDSMSVAEAGLANGHMLYAEVSPDSAHPISGHPASGHPSGSKVMTTIGKDGSIHVTEVTTTWASSLFGANLLTKGGMKSSLSVLNGKKRIGLYFSAHWCPPCRAFTPMLATFYDQLQSEDPNALEIIFVSSDKDEHSFNEYFNDMPWVSIPFSEQSLSRSLMEQFGVKGIPSLIILDGATGKTKDPDGRSTLMKSRGLTKEVLKYW